MVMSLKITQELRGFKITHDMVHADMWTWWWALKLHKNRGDLKLLMT